MIQHPAAQASGVAIVAVHGVNPTPQYAFQDQVASALAARLNAADQTTDWTADVLEPGTPPVAAGKPPNATVTRVYRRRDRRSLRTPGREYFDVYEAYWSPLDKIPITLLATLAWLLHTLLAPINSTAYLHSDGKKTAFDAGFVVVGVAVIVLAVAGSAWALLCALGAIATISAGVHVEMFAAAEALMSPSALAKLITWRSVALLACGALGGYLLFESVVVFSTIVRQAGLLRIRGRQRVIRLAIAFGTLIAGLILLLVAMLWPTDGGGALGWNAVLFVIAAGALAIARWIGESAFISFFRDVLIYTTRDENISYYDLRERILELVTERIRQTTLATANGGVPYERVIIMAHSLGSTIAMDALIRLQQLLEQEAYDPDDMNRIRAFITFGTALEKTKFFFDKTNPTPSQSMNQWRNDVYGALFTADADELDEPNGDDVGIYWANYWYFVDPVSDRIESYRSFLVPGETRLDAPEVRAGLPTPPAGKAILGRVVAADEPGSRPLWRAGIAHVDYLGDVWFWGTPGAHRGALSVVRRAAVPREAVRFAPHRTLAGAARAVAPAGPAHAARYVVVTGAQASRFIDKVTAPPKTSAPGSRP